jgi:DUF1009 family protein
MAMRLGIIAGGGDVPRHLIQHCVQTGIQFHVFIIAGQQTDPCLAAYPHTMVRLGAGRALLNALRVNTITDIVLIGAVRRPSVWSLLPDWFVITRLPRLGLAALGDDGLLRNVIAIFEEHGFHVRGVHEIMPDLLASTGPMTATKPDAAAMADIVVGIEAATHHGQADKGQAVVVRSGRVIAREGKTGTDAMLQSIRGSGVLVKLCKPQQDERVDLPTIGIRTVQNAVAAGLSGIAVSAGRTLVNDRAATIAEADKHGIFIIGVDA